MRVHPCLSLVITALSGCAPTTPHAVVPVSPPSQSRPSPGAEALASIDERLASLERIFGNYFSAPKEGDARFPAARQAWLALEQDLLPLAGARSGDWDAEYRLGELYSLGHNFDHPGAWQASERHFKRALEIDGRRGSAYLGLGLLYVNSSLSLAPEAERLFRKAIELRDNSLIGAWRGLSFALYYQGRLEDALAAAETCLELAPNDRAARSIRDTVAKKLSDSSAK